MKEKLVGLSAYLSSFEDQKSFLEKFAHEDRLVFTSLHIPEEMDDTFVERALEMLLWLKEKGFRTIGDISKRTLKQFGCEDILTLAEKLGLYMLRIDYGFTTEEIIEAGKHYPLAFNASTVNEEEAAAIRQHCKQMIAIHNFYPREYTGLSHRQFEKMNKALAEQGVDVIVFIPSVKWSRGPVYAGLPTLEHQRMVNPAINYLEMMQEPYVQGVILADVGLDDEDKKRICLYEKEKIISVPVCFEAPYSHLKGQTYTIRVDSPERLLRLQESREFATPGQHIMPFQCIDRKRGVITCDNERYGRYSGELQIIKEELPMDARVNVIGYIPTPYVEIVDFIPNGYKIRFE